MQRINRSKFIILAAILCLPINLWATRGSDDYGLIMISMFIVFTFPFGLILLFFILNSIIKLKSSKPPEKKQGNIIFIISIIIIPVSILIPIAWMYNAKWHKLMIEVMLADFLPILLLSIISAVLALFVKKRSLNIMEDAGRKIFILSEKIKVILSSKLLIALIIFLLLSFIYYFFF